MDGDGWLVSGDNYVNNIINWNVDTLDGLER
jgi:hypothetical protein